MYEYTYSIILPLPLIFVNKSVFNPIPPGLFLEPVTPRGGSIWPPSHFKSTKAVDMKLWPEVDNYKKFQFEQFLENFILLFVSYDVSKLKAIENNWILNTFLL